MSNVKLLKLTTGEEVVCNVLEDGDLTLKVDECVLVGLQRDEQTGKLGIGLMPFCPSARFPIDIDKDKIVFVAEPADGAIAAHKQAFSKIFTGPQGLTLPRK